MGPLVSLVFDEEESRCDSPADALSKCSPPHRSPVSRCEAAVPWHSRTPVSRQALLRAPSPAASPAASPVASPMASPVALNYTGSLNWYQFGYTPGGGTVASRLADEAVGAFQ